MPTAKGNLWYVFEKRLMRHQFEANPPSIEVLKDLSIVNSVFDREMKFKFKGSEERLLFRVEEWIKECTVPLAPSDAKLPVDEVPMSETSKKPKADKKIRSRSLGRMISRSLNNLDAFRLDNSNGLGVRKPLAKSTEDLSATNEPAVELALQTYGTLPRKKLKVPWFKKKDLLEERHGNEKSAKKKPGHIARRIKNRRKKYLDENQNTTSGNLNSFPASALDTLRMNTAPAKVTKHRPSLFDMVNLKKDGYFSSEFDLDVGEQASELEDSFSGKSLGSELAKKKYHTVTGLDVRENHFKDSFRIAHSRNVRNFVATDTLFYNPEPKKAEMGLI